MIVHKNFILVFVMMNLIVSLNLKANERAQPSECVDKVHDMLDETITSITSKWHKRGMFLFGLLNGFYLPLTYALAMGLNVVDLSHPVLKENLQPFAKGATLGIGCWFAYKIIEWYLQLAVLKTINVALQNPVINKVVRENNVMALSDTGVAT